MNSWNGRGNACKNGTNTPEGQARRDDGARWLAACSTQASQLTQPELPSE